MTEVVEAPAAPRPALAAPDTTPDLRPPRRWRPRSTSRRVLLLAAVLILAQLLVRTWVALAGVLSQNDLVVAGRSARLPLVSSEFLLADDGRFAPLADLLTGVLTRVAPLEYWPMAAALVLLQALASLAVLRLLRLLLGDRPVLLLPLVLYLFSPLALAAFDNWTIAVSAVPFQAGLAWVCGDAIALSRTGRARYAVSGTLVFAIVLCFGEQALVIPVIAVIVLALVLRQSGEASPLVGSLRRARWLWVGLVATGAALVWRFWSAVQPRTVAAEQSGSLATAVDAVSTSVTDGILPGLVGGPLFWTDFGTWADPPAALVVGAALVVLAAGWISWRRRAGGVVWALLVGYVVTNVLVLVVSRLTRGVTAEFALDLRFFPDIVPVAAIAVALVARAPARYATRTLLDRTERRDAAVLLTVFFLGLSLWSTASYNQTRDNGIASAYLATAQRSLLSADVPVLDHAVAGSAVWGLSTPYNRVSWVFAPVGVQTSTSTHEPRVLGPLGTLVDARVAAQYGSVPGPRPDCGYYVEPLGSSRVILGRAAAEAWWTVQLNYLASSDGWILVTPENGEPEVAPVRAGANAVYLSLRGGGGHLRVSSETPDMSLCVDTAAVGLLESAD